jgi:hypothetical protein
MDRNYGAGIRSFIYSPSLPDYAFKRLGVCIVLDPKGIMLTISQAGNNKIGGLHIMDIYIDDNKDFIRLADKLIKEYGGICQKEHFNKMNTLIFIYDKRHDVLDWLDGLVMISKLTK